MVRRFACCLLVATGAVALYACKDMAPLPPAAGEPGQAQPISNDVGGTGVSQEDAGSTVADGGGLTLPDGAVVSCTALALAGVVVDEEETAGNLPAGSGGTIANGAYNLTQVSKYLGAAGGTAGPTGVTYQSTIQITNGTTFERVVDLGSNATATATEERSIGIMVPTSPTVSITFNCPLQSTEQYSYTATETQLVLNNTSTGESYTYVKQL